MNQFNELYDDALELLRRLISIPSYSREEDRTADAIQEFLRSKGISCNRSGNNVWAINAHFRPGLPTILLNSHHDTVRPNSGYTRDPFDPAIEEGKLYGLGSNDAGGCLVGLIAAFRHFYDNPALTHNLVITATAEEEISGHQGVESILGQFPAPDFSIVGEPTLNDLAIAEKGLLVLDCTSHGKAGHAAREEGDNAIYRAIEDIAWFRNFRFSLISESLGQVKMTVTVINAGQQHNVVPATCHFTVDIRVTDRYTHEEVLEIVREHVRCQVEPRSMRMRSSGISPDHALVRAARDLGRKLYGSPTTSDQALIPGPSVKIGPGDSARSHSADEFIYLDELREGIGCYIRLLDRLILKPSHD
ncbi:MAG TPA: M20 family metallo-hydrolase [Chitinophagaceae bacterium]|nr:M20 family metallo-hydrolase [Chitinophagaceae bacterium]